LDNLFFSKSASKYKNQDQEYLDAVALDRILKL